MSTFTTKTTSGTPVIVSPNDRIVSIGARVTDVYVNKYVPVGEGMTDPRRILFPIDIGLQKLVGLSPTPPYAPVYGATQIIKGQSEPKSVDEIIENDGPNVLHSRECVVFNEYGAGSVFGSFQTHLVDAFDGQMVAGLFSVTFYTTSVIGGDKDIGIPGTATNTPLAVDASYVSLEDQYEGEDTHRIKRGDGLIVVKTSEISQAQIESSSFIEINVLGGIASRYTLWDGKIKRGQASKFMIYLRRRP